MPCEAILHAQRGAEGTVTSRNSGKAISKCPGPVRARAATSLYVILSRLSRSHGKTGSAYHVLVHAKFMQACSSFRVATAVLTSIRPHTLDGKYHSATPGVVRKSCFFKTMANRAHTAGSTESRRL
eukprot:6189961-Pleurochrysis_carterae.AAC.3